MRVAVVLIVTFLAITALGIGGCTSGASANNVLASQPQLAAVKITGAAAAYPALEALASSYKARVKGIDVVFLPGNYSEGGIAGAKDGLADIGAVSRKLKPEESDGLIHYRELATDAMLVATNLNVAGITGLTTGDLKAIYSGTVRNWRDLGGPNARIVVLDRPEDDTAKMLLRQKYLGDGLKIAKSAVLLQQDAELVKTLVDTPYSIGIFSLAMAQAVDKNQPVNHLRLNGVAPTVQNVLAGRYQMVRDLGIVWRDDTSADTKQFIEFVFSKDGAAELMRSGFVPLPENE